MSFRDKREEFRKAAKDMNKIINEMTDMLPNSTAKFKFKDNWETFKTSARNTTKIKLD